MFVVVGSLLVDSRLRLPSVTNDVIGHDSLRARVEGQRTVHFIIVCALCSRRSPCDGLN